MNTIMLKIIIPVMNAIEKDSPLEEYLSNFITDLNNKLQGHPIHLHDLTLNYIDIKYTIIKIKKSLRIMRVGLMEVSDMEYHKHYVNNKSNSLMLVIKCTLF